MSSSHRNAEQDTFRWVYLLLARLVSQIVTYFSRYPITVKLCRRLRALNFHLVFFGLTDFAYLCLCLAFLSLTSRLTRLPVSSADWLCLSSAWSADFCGSSLVSKVTKARRLFPAPFRVCIQGCRRISEDLKKSEWRRSLFLKAEPCDEHWDEELVWCEELAEGPSAPPMLWKSSLPFHLTARVSRRFLCSLVSLQTFLLSVRPNLLEISALRSQESLLLLQIFSLTSGVVCSTEPSGKWISFSLCGQEGSSRLLEALETSCWWIYFFILLISCIFTPGSVGSLQPIIHEEFHSCWHSRRPKIQCCRSAQRSFFSSLLLLLKIRLRLHKHIMRCIFSPLQRRQNLWQ